MLISKFDLYKAEWLELVFDDRNKSYGAYELRQHNGRTMATAMAIAFGVVAVPLIIIGLLAKQVVPVVVPPFHTVVVPLINPVYPPVIQPPPHSTAHVRTVTPPAASSVIPKVFIPLVVSATPATVEPPKVTELTGPIASAITPGAGNGTAIVDGTTGSPGGGPGGAVSNEPVSTVGLQRMPMPYGGSEAWSKFLQKHLKYPDMAADAHVQGKVFISFIVEKDGHLSNIVIDRGIGYGLDEEALRVLKLSPAWMPGIQNNQPVRVKFNIPINFQMGDDND